MAEKQQGYWIMVSICALLILLLGFFIGKNQGVRYTTGMSEDEMIELRHSIDSLNVKLDSISININIQKRNLAEERAEINQKLILSFCLLGQ